MSKKDLLIQEAARYIARHKRLDLTEVKKVLTPLRVTTNAAGRIVTDDQISENAWNQLGQKKPVGYMLPIPDKETVKQHNLKFQEGDRVIPHTGPHANEVHTVVSARKGTVNLVLTGNQPIKYDSISVRARHEDLTPVTVGGKRWS